MYANYLAPVTDQKKRHGGRLCTLIFSRLCTLIFSRLCTLTSSTLSEMLRNIGNSRAMEEVIFFSLVHPGALFARFGVAFAPWTSLASTEVWSLWSDLRDAFHARSQHLSQVTSKTLRLLLWNIFLEYIRCYVVTSFSSNLHNACDAML